jgi:hypothetical protein
MRKSVFSKVVLAVLLALAARSGCPALASTPDQGGSSQTSSSGSTTTITGTDPEPIDPGLVNLILALLGVG